MKRATTPPTFAGQVGGRPPLLCRWWLASVAVLWLWLWLRLGRRRAHELQLEPPLPPQPCVGGRLRPSLLLVGCQKCGTTGLWGSLTRGGSFVSACQTTKSDAKECRVFNGHPSPNALREFGDTYCARGHVTRNYCQRLFEQGPKNLSFFLRQFDPCGAVAATSVPIDASPTYIARPHVARTVADVLGSSRVKFLFAVREPVSRTVSYYNHAVRSNWGSLGKRHHRQGLTFSTWIDETLEHVDQCLHEHAISADALWPFCGILGFYAAFYGPQLAHWLRAFEARRFLVLSFEAFVADPSGVLLDVHAFAGVRVSTSASSQHNDVGRGHRASFSHLGLDNASDADRARLAAFWESPNEHFRDVLRRHPAIAKAPRQLPPTEFLQPPALGRGR